MSLNLAGKSALITGGTRGIGLALAARLARAGARVAIAGRSGAKLDAALRSLTPKTGEAALSVLGRTADVQSEDEVRLLFEWFDEQFGALDILVNNAGVGIFGNLAEIEPEAWNTLVGTNLTGVYHCCHHAIPRMVRQGSGWIINIASLAAKHAFAGGAAYNATKFALLGMSEALLLDHRYEGLKVSTVLPGSVNTDFSRSGPAAWKLEPEDVAETVAMLLALPDRALISHVEVRPSRPPRK